jgi:hypothetical protein
MEGKDLASDGVHGNPNPLPIRPLPDEAAELVYLGFQTVQNHSLSTCSRLDIQMLRSGGKTFAHEIQEPAEANSYRTADPAQ